MLFFFVFVGMCSAPKVRETSNRLAEIELPSIRPNSSQIASSSLHALPYQPCTLAWRHIGYTVFEGREKRPKQLLNDIRYQLHGIHCAEMGLTVSIMYV